MINRDKFKEMFAEYKANFETTFQNERFKWEAIKCFQDNWNIDAPNFAEMLNKSLDKTGSLLTSRKKGFPILSKDMIVELAKFDQEKVRKMFIDLYDESKNNVGERIALFSKEAQNLTKRFKLKKDNKAKNAFQSLSAISTYLWLRFPDKYYIYKKDLANNLAKNLDPEYNFDKGNIQTKYAFFLKFNNEIKEDIKKEIQKDKDLLEMLNKNLTEKCYKDPEFITLTIDFGYYFGKNEKSNQSRIQDNIMEDERSNVNYWWLCSHPSYFSFTSIDNEEEKSWTLYNESGHKRRIFKNFLEAKAYDKIILYESSPVKKILGLGYVSKNHDENNFYFKKSLVLSNPINVASIREREELRNMEFIRSPQGSLFKLTKDEFNIILNIIRSENPELGEVVEYSPSQEECLTVSESDYQFSFDSERFKDVFIADENLKNIISILRNKKNIILQGAPGVGKTYVAERLAYRLLEDQANDRIDFVQFHQSYSYEDFIMGYRPKENGEGFERRNGAFYSFCKKAEKEPGKPFVFLIDEINRGNISKIFGELLMLIEPDKRGKQLRLLYSDEKFSVPNNVYIIGMMNTADRSLAMLDYALRRRFAFFDIKPAFANDKFKHYYEGLGNVKLNKLIETIKELNSYITTDASLGEGFCIGHSYFCNKSEISDQILSNIVEYELLPLLKEYWFDEKSKVVEWSERLRSAIR